MSSVVLTDEEEERLDIVTEPIQKVVHYYIGFLLATTYPEDVEEAHVEDDRKRRFRKFLAIRKELFKFLSSHKHFFDLESVALVINDGIEVYKNEISILNSGEEFLKFNDVLKLRDVMDFFRTNKKTITHVYDIKENEKAIYDTVKVKLGKSSITIENVKQFIENNYLIDIFNTKCSNYKDYAAHIRQRIDDYVNSKVSVEHINEMSFRFQGPIEGFEDKTSCPVCLEDYGMDQEICRLPCNHFCCRVCTERMFSTANEGMQSNILCPVCRDDCT